MAFNGRFVLNLAHLAARNGGDISEFIQMSGKSDLELEEENCIVEDGNYNAIIEQAVRITKDDYFGLHAGVNLNLSAAGLILQLAQSSSTVKEALELACQYANLGCSVLPMNLVEEEKHFKILFEAEASWRSSSELAFRHTALGVIAFKIREFKSLTRMQHEALRVNLSWEKDGDRKEFERVFGCSAHFGSKELSIVFDKKHLNEKVVSSNYELLKLLIAHAEEINSSLKNKKDFSCIVRQSIIKLIKPYFPTIEEVAAHLNISSRTLQRRFAEADQT